MDTLLTIYINFTSSNKHLPIRVCVGETGSRASVMNKFTSLSQKDKGLVIGGVVSVVVAIVTSLVLMIMILVEKRRSTKSASAIHVTPLPAKKPSPASKPPVSKSPAAPEEPVTPATRPPSLKAGPYMITVSPKGSPDNSYLSLRSDGKLVTTTEITRMQRFTWTPLRSPSIAEKHMFSAMTDGLSGFPLMPLSVGTLSSPSGLFLSTDGKTPAALWNSPKSGTKFSTIIEVAAQDPDTGLPVQNTRFLFILDPSGNGGYFLKNGGFDMASKYFMDVFRVWSEYVESGSTATPGAEELFLIPLSP